MESLEYDDLSPAPALRFRTPGPDTPPPTAVDSEAALLAAVITDPALLPDVAALIGSAQPFWNETHATLWATTLEMYRKGETIDMVTVATALTKKGLDPLHRFGMPDTLLGRLLITYPLSWNAMEYASAVMNSYQIRELIEVGNTIVADGYANRFEAHAVHERAMARLKAYQCEGSTKTVQMGDLMPEVFKNLGLRSEGRMTGLMTQFVSLNNLTGGFQPQDLVVLAAQQSVGKTSVALGIASHVSIYDAKPSLIVSLEMGNPQLVERVLSSLSGVSSVDMKIGRLTEEQWIKLKDARQWIESAPLRLIHKPGRTLTKLVMDLRQAKAKHGVKLIIVDYMQLLRTDRRGSEYDQLSEIATEMKQLANDLETPIMLLSQLSREVMKRDGNKPRSSDLRGSGQIEEAADLLMFLHRPSRFDPHDQPGYAELILDKNRGGPTGVCKLRFKDMTMTFEDAPDEVEFISPADSAAY